MPLALFNAILFHPLRDIATVALVVALLLGYVCWPGRDVARWRAVTVAAFLYTLPWWAYETGREAWARLNRAAGRRP